MPCQTVSTLQSYDLNPITKNLIVKAFQDVCSTEDVNQAKINAGSEIYSKLVDEKKNWTTHIVSIDMAQAYIAAELESLKTQQQWSNEFYDTVQAFSTITAAESHCHGRLVTDGVSFIEVRAIASLSGDDGQRHMQIIKSRHDLQLSPQIDTVILHHQKPIYKTVNRRRNRFLGLIWDKWQETVLDHYETVSETKTVQNPRTMTAQDFDNLKSFALHQLCNAVL